MANSIIISIDNSKKTIKYFDLQNGSDSGIVTDAVPFTTPLYSAEFYDELGTVLLSLEDKYHTIVSNGVNIVIPDISVSMDQLSVPVVKGVNVKNTFSSAIDNLFPKSSAITVQQYLLLQTKQLTTCSYTFVNSEMIKGLRAACLKNRIKIKNISFEANTTQLALSSYAPKLKALNYLFMDIKGDTTKFVFVYKGRCIAFYNLPFGYQILESEKVVAENMLFNHDLGELEVLNAKERARAKALTVLTDDYKILEAARSKSEADENEENPEVASANAEINKATEDEEQEESITDRIVKPVNIKTLPKKTERILPKFMQRPEPTTPEELVYENFRVFVKWALNLLHENDKITTLGGFDSVYVNMPQHYNTVLDKVNEEAEENGYKFLPVNIAKKSRTVLENLDIIGGSMMSNSSQNIF